MNADHPPDPTVESVDVLGEKPTAPPPDPAGEHLPEKDSQPNPAGEHLPEKDSQPNPTGEHLPEEDSQPKSLVADGKPTASGMEPSESPPSLRSMAHSGGEEADKMDQQNSGSSPALSSSEKEFEFAPPLFEMKSESSPSVDWKEDQGQKHSSSLEQTPAAADNAPKVESSSSQPFDKESEISAGQMEEHATAKKAPPPEKTGPEAENPELLTGLPTPLKKSMFTTQKKTRMKDDELKRKVAIPHYLTKGMVDAIESAGVAYADGPPVNDVKAPESPMIVFINSKSGGRLGPQLEALMVDLIAPTQVFDLSKCNPVEVLRYGLGHLEKVADAGDNTALEARNKLRVMVAGGDGTVGWVLGSIAQLGLKERFEVPPVGVIPLGTGNDLSRSFRWGGSTTSISRKAGRRWLNRAIEANVKTLDSWQVVVKPAPTRQDAPLKLPHAMHPQHHIPLEDPGSGEKESDNTPYFEGSFWNYFSLGMDAQVAYGFHTLRDEAPWLTSGPVSNQMVYGGYGCIQGWFCTPCATAPIARGLKQIAKIHIQRDQDADASWEELELPANIRAIVILNLQSYAGGRNPWGRPRRRRLEKEQFVEAKYNDGLLEIVGFRDGWHTAFVLIDWLSAVRLGQARAVKLELRGTIRRSEAYMQIDGEPWQQALGAQGEPPAVVEIFASPMQSKCLLRK